MIHAYDTDVMYIARAKLGAMIEIAVNIKKISIEDFIQIFLKSRLCSAFERGSNVWVLGKSSIELLEILLEEEINDYDICDYPTPEYWTGFILVFTQWYYNLQYETILKYVPIKQILGQYFPYHEMDILQMAEYINSHIPFESELKKRREKLNLTQEQLAIISGVSIRNIRAYEQGSIELSKAQGDTLFQLSKALNCSIEELIFVRK